MCRCRTVEKKKNALSAMRRGRFLWVLNGSSACLRSLYGTYASASAAIQASVSVDHILVIALRDRACRTFVSTSTTADASVSNLICHNDTPPLYVSCGWWFHPAIIILSYFQKKSSPFCEKIQNLHGMRSGAGNCGGFEIWTGFV